MNTIDGNNSIISTGTNSPILQNCTVYIIQEHTSLYEVKQKKTAHNKKTRNDCEPMFIKMDLYRLLEKKRQRHELAARVRKPYPAHPDHRHQRDVGSTIEKSSYRRKGIPRRDYLILQRD